MALTRGQSGSSEAIDQHFGAGGEGLEVVCRGSMAGEGVPGEDVPEQSTKKKMVFGCKFESRERRLVTSR